MDVSEQIKRYDARASSGFIIIYCASLLFYKRICPFSSVVVLVCLMFEPDWIYEADILDVISF